MPKGDSSEDNSFDIFSMSRESKRAETSKLHMIVDTEATKTVIGEITLREILENGSADQRDRIMQKQEHETDSAANINFGDGKTIAAQKILHIPWLMSV